MKFGLPMASSATLVAWSILDFKQGYLRVGQYDWALEEIKFALDYFIKCNQQIDQDKFYFQVSFN